MPSNTVNAYRRCPVCNHYLERRAVVLAPEIALRALIRGVSPDVVAHEFMTAVHRRHLAGGCLSTRRRTPDKVNEDGSTRMHVKRCCNGCGTDIGDATEEELEAAADGRRLPDVILECGCSTDAEAA